jgi:hypothetical protein
MVCCPVEWTGMFSGSSWKQGDFGWNEVSVAICPTGVVQHRQRPCLHRLGVVAKLSEAKRNKNFRLGGGIARRILCPKLAIDLETPVLLTIIVDGVVVLKDLCPLNTGADPGLWDGERGAGRFTLNFVVNFKVFSNFRHFTVNFKDLFLWIRPAPPESAPAIHNWDITGATNIKSLQKPRYIISTNCPNCLMFPMDNTLAQHYNFINPSLPNRNTYGTSIDNSIKLKPTWINSVSWLFLQSTIKGAVSFQSNYGVFRCGLV